MESNKKWVVILDPYTYPCLVASGTLKEVRLAFEEQCQHLKDFYTPGDVIIGTVYKKEFIENGELLMEIIDIKEYYKYCGL